MKPVVGLVETGSAAGVLVAAGAAGEFVQSGFGMNRVILPVAVATDSEEIVRHVFVRPTAELVSFVAESGIGVVVVLARPVRSDNRRGTHQHFPAGIAL